MSRRLLLVAAFAVALPCAAQQPPPSPAGPAPAVIADTSSGGGDRGAVFFYIAEIDGAQPATDAERMSWRNSPWLFQTGYTPPADVRREVEPGLRRLLLVGNHAYASAMATLILPREKVTGMVEVTLQAGRRYRVNGVVDAFRREVWLEDEDGRMLPNTHIIDKHFQDAAQSKEMAGAQYTCCNLHYQNDWISDANFITLPMIPAGARIVVKEYGRHRAQVLIEGRPMRIGLDYGRERETREQFVAKLMVAEDPRQRLATYDSAVRKAIQRGRVAIGMTRDQVVMSLGHPRTDLNASLDAPHWVYVTHDHDEYYIVWGPDGRVKSIESDAAGVRASVLHESE